MSFFDTTSWDEFPVGRKPVPSSLAELYSSRAAFDPDLFLTPEKKRVPTLVKLNSTDATEFTSSSLRQSKVHFDQNVAVHHLSPDVSTDISSVMNSSEERNASPDALQTSYGRDPESPPIVRIDLSAEHLDYFSPEDSEISSPRSDSTGELCTDEICRSYMSSSLTKDFNSFGLTDPELDLSLANSTDCEPISVMASDLRTAYNSSLSKPVGARVSTSKKSESLSAATVNRSRPRAGLVRSGDGLEKPRLRTSGSQGFASGGASAAVGGGTAMGGVLARPELNSTLRLTREMAELRAKEFDRHAVLKGNLDPKLKGKIDEKAYAKLNADSALYTNLLSLDVQEEELLNRAAEVQQAKAKPESGERVKPEDMVSKPPDIMEFFTPDLQPESPSFTLFGITQELTGPRTVDLDRAFDVYRHIRVWDRLN